MANGNGKKDTKVLPPKDIVTAAYKYMAEIMGEQTDKMSYVRLEELEPADNGAAWHVVLSYELAGEFPFDKKREYKQLKVAKDGHVISMKIKPVS